MLINFLTATCSIEKGMKGFSTHQKLDKFGMRGSNTCEVRRVDGSEYCDRPGLILLSGPSSYLRIVKCPRRMCWARSTVALACLCPVSILNDWFYRVVLSV